MSIGQVVGTLACLEAPQRDRIKGFIVNRFRGELALFADGVGWIERRTGKPAFGVLPWFDHIRIEPEESVVIESPRKVNAPAAGGRAAIGVIWLPHISNFTDFEPLSGLSDLRVHFLEQPQDLAGFRAVVLPGSKNTELTFLKGKGEKGFYVELIEAILKAQEKKFKEAESHLNFALQKEPGHPVAIYYSGSLSVAQNNLEKAENAFKTVIASNPNFPPALAGLGQVFWQKKKTQEAISYYQKAIENDQENLIYRRQLIEIYKSTAQKEAENKAIMEMLYYIPGVREIQLG